MRHVIRAVPLVACVLVLAGPAFAQPAAPQPDPTPRDILLKHWSDAGEKIVKMAEDFPEDKYEFTPNPAVRSFADNLRHVAFWNGVVAGNARGEKVDGKQNELPKAQYATKAAVVKALKESLAEATAQLKNGPASPSPKLLDLWVSFTEHAGEHYGQLVVYYRLTGLVHRHLAETDD